MKQKEKIEILKLANAMQSLRHSNCEIVFQCEKCYEKFSTDECLAHCKEKKHYKFKLLGTNLIRSFL